MNNRNHLFHIVDPSPWPFLIALGVFYFTSGLAFYMHRILGGSLILIFGFIFLLIIAICWFRDITTEATFFGYHTLVVKSGLKLGFLLFIASEIMLFLGFFWAFFHSSICPSIDFGYSWPPAGINAIYIGDYPLLNTLILIISGFAVTWVHRGMSLGLFSEAIMAFFITIFLGLLFIILQIYEYYEATYIISDSVYSSVFYMLTGLHGLHVIVGVIFLTICFFRLLWNHFTTNHYLGLVFAIWYWHFVDIVWIGLFLVVYGWGNW